MKLWDKGFSVHDTIEKFTVGRDRELDLYLAHFDVLASRAHADMLADVGLITRAEQQQLAQGLDELAEQLAAGTFVIEAEIEDVHSKIEAYLTERFGDAGWVNIMAHEWGHHVQFLTGILATQGDVILLELQATCFAGVYVQNAVDRGLVSTDSLVVMEDMFAGDSGHGNRDALVGAFDSGYSGGLTNCGLTI